ncbi:uncharacterized protein LOC134186832 isoform X2 [Corticium candelabrum]|uniref:uncharacterized protein LOC134186832 isoform X2 n=1 Tax=Corticium candelabrum TaxID=121492 RepID=UPI002E26610E|nr:uncharacterized protein LOC134186832 isoform X2 [Corticium candelabrum]
MNPVLLVTIEDLLFPGCPLTKRSSSVLIMLFILQHKLSAQACKDLMQLISAHFPVGHRAMTSLYCLKSYLHKTCAPMKPMKAFVCPSCEDLIANSADQCGTYEFLFFYVKNALSRLFKDSEFCSKLSASFEKRNNADMSDLTSGKRYRNMTTGLLSKWNITLTLNTDVVSVFRTSRTGSLWPVYLTINELSSECRFSLKYAIVCDLWFHPSKPPIQVFLQPLMSQLKELSTNGETFKTAEGLQHCKVTFLDERLLSIKAPDHFSRIPHMLKEFSTWKASEYRSWLFYWSLSVLRGILPREYYIHYSLLVVGCRLLCGMKISSNDIDRARQLLLKFYERHELLYGTTSCTMKMHILQHLSEFVERSGPLWASYFFFFEKLHGVLKILCMRQDLCLIRRGCAFT